MSRSKTMKKQLIFLSLVFIGMQGFSQEKTNKLSMNPIQLFGFNITNFEYERGFNEGKLGVAFFYGNTGNATRAIGGYKMYLAEQNISIKGYLNSISKSSFWYGGQLSVASGDIIYDYDFNSEYNEEERDKYFNNRAIDIGTLGVTGKVGYQLILGSFYLDFFGGLGYALTNDLFGDAEYSGEVEEVKLLLTYGIKTGIAF